MPTISPLRTSNETSLTTRSCVNGSWMVQFFTSSTVSPTVRGRRGNMLVSGRPTMFWIIRSSGMAVLASVMTVRPSRSTVIRSAIRATSFSRCEM